MIDRFLAIAVCALCEEPKGEGNTNIYIYIYIWADEILIDQLVNSYVLCYFSYSGKLLPLVVRRPLSV